MRKSRHSVRTLPRPDGLSSFLADRIALRKALALCKGCEYRMPKRWKERYDYEEFTAFHGDFSCDYCRRDSPVSLYLAGEQGIVQDLRESQDSERAVRLREYELQQKFPGAIIL